MKRTWSNNFNPQHLEQKHRIDISTCRGTKMNRQLFINDYIQNPKQMAVPEKMTKKEGRKWGKIKKFMRINLSSTTEVHCLQLQVQLDLKVFHNRLLLSHRLSF